MLSVCCLKVAWILGVFVTFVTTYTYTYQKYAEYAFDRPCN